MVNVPDDHAGRLSTDLHDHLVAPRTATTVERGQVVADEHQRASDAQLRGQRGVVVLLKLDARLLARTILRDPQIDSRAGHGFCLLPPFRLRPTWSLPSRKEVRPGEVEVPLLEVDFIRQHRGIPSL